MTLQVLYSIVSTAIMPTARKTSKEPTRVTLKFLAEYLNLSPTTVSVVLTNSPLAKTIALRTKERIWEAVRKFQYRPKYCALCPHTKRTFSIAVLVPDIGDEFSAIFISGIESKLAEVKYNYFVESHRFARQQIADSPTTLMDRQVEGMIFINTPLRQQMPVPVVAISDITNAPGVTRIVIDNYHAVRLGLRHLKELGHRQIAFFKGPEHNGDTECRWNAILKAAGELGLVVKPELTATMGNYFEAGEKSMMQRGYAAASMLLHTSRNFTALLAFNGGSAVGAIRAMQDIGLSVPGNVSVVGIDDVQIAAFISPRLTTIRQPLRQMGAIAASTLFQRFRGEEVPDDTAVQPYRVVVE